MAATEQEEKDLWLLPREERELWAAIIDQGWLVSMIVPIGAAQL